MNRTVTRRSFNPFTRLRRLATISFLNWCAARVTGELATAREHLSAAEEDLRVVGPYDRRDLAAEIATLRRTVEGLEEEAAYITAKRDILREVDGCCPCDEEDGDQRAAA